MTTDPRLPAFLACARERSHPYYAAAALVLARRCGDTAAMEEAIRLGAANYRRSKPVRARTEDETLLDGAAAEIAQMALWGEQ